VLRNIPLIGFLLFAALAAYITRDKPWKKAAIFLIGLPLIYLLNIGRITAILIIGFYYGEQLALQMFHLLGGLVLIMFGTLIILLIAEKLLRAKIFTKTQPPQQCPECNRVEGESRNYCSHCGRLLKYPVAIPSKSDVAKIAAIVITVMLLMSIQAPVFALTKGPAQVIIQTPMGEQGNTEILPQVQGYSLSFFYRDKNFENEANQDASLLYIYEPRNNTGRPVWVSVEVASTTASLHPWEVCLITWPQTHGYQPTATQLDLRDIRISENPPIVARYFAFQYTNHNETQVVLYWYETSTFDVNGTAEQKHVKTSLITYPNNGENITKEEDNLLLFATAIANYWQPIKMWTQVALAISQNGLTLTAATTTLLASLIIFGTVQKMRERKAKAKAYDKLSRADQQTIYAALQAEKTSIPTLQNITATYQRTTQAQIGQEAVLEKLIQAEETGMVRRQLISVQDEPTQVWKTNLSKPIDRSNQ